MYTFVEALSRARRLFANDVAVVSGTALPTHAETWSRCRWLAGCLGRLGVQPGDRVAILALNCHQYLEVYLAVPASGRVVVPLNTRHAEPELRYALEDAGTRLLITDRDPGALAKSVEQVVSLPDDYERLLATAPEADLGVGVTEDTLAGLFYTGGTTGASKGVMLSHRNLMANTVHWLVATQQGPEDVFLVMAPMFHAAGSVAALATVWLGGRQVILPGFDPVTALEAIGAERVTITLGVPTMLAALAEEQLARPREVETVRSIIHGGSPIATEVVRRAHAAFPRAELMHLYGATEMAPLATALRHEETLIDGDLARSCGRAVAGVDVRIVDQGGRELPPGEIGEVVVRGPNGMPGDWNKPEGTAVVCRDGWHRSGDLGFVDAAGYLFLVDRAKDMIISGGENVYSTEVEEVLYQHPAVLEAAVFGVPDAKWGEAVHAIVVPRAGQAVAPVDLIAFCRERIAAYKVPKQIDLRDEPLPKSGPGKVLKRELRAPFWAGHTAQIH